MRATTFKIATYNLYNFFSGLDATPLRLEKHARVIADVLDAPALLLVQEVGDETLLQRLGRRVDALAGTAYRAAAPPTSDRRGIRVGFLWDERQIRAEKVFQLEGPEVEAAFGPDSPRPGREPLVGRFAVGKRLLHAVVCHLKSDYVPEDREDEREALLAASAAQRGAQARVIRDVGLPALLGEQSDRAWVLVGGDMNGAPDTAPLEVLEGKTSRRPLRNLLVEKGPPDAYTFVRDEGGPVIIDHLLASEELAARCSTVMVPHINCAASPLEIVDPEEPRGASDHDPLLAVFRL